MQQRSGISTASDEVAPKNGAGEVGATSSGRWRSFLRHPLAPLVLLMVVLQLVRDEYPLSHYPMYRRPGPEPNGYFYLATAEGQPLPVTWHTGMTAAQIGKQFLTKRLDYVKEEERRTGTSGRDFSDELMTSFDQQAGADVLHYLRELSVTRNSDEERHLTGGLQLVGGSLRRGAEGLVDRQLVIATVEPAAENGGPGAQAQPE